MHLYFSGEYANLLKKVCVKFPLDEKVAQIQCIQNKVTRSKPDFGGQKHDGVLVLDGS